MIVSSDLTHYGFNYNYIPFTDMDMSEAIKELDKEAIKHITELNNYNFMRFIDKYKTTICGLFAISLLISMMKSAGKKAKLLKYYTSGDVVGDYSSAVGYAAIIFE